MARLLVLDVDGVIYPDGAARPHEGRPGTGGWDDWRRAPRRPRWPDAPGRVPLKVSRQMGAAIAELCRDTGAELWWLTTWQQGAVDYVSPALGLREHTAGALMWWDGKGHAQHGRKSLTLAAWLRGRSLAGHRDTVAWADDELAPGGVLHQQQTAGACPVDTCPVPVLRLGCDPREGLTMAHLQLARGHFSRSR